MSLSKSFTCAFSGLGYVLRTQQNARIQVAVAVSVGVVAGFSKITLTEWAILVSTVGAVFAAEICNTVVETVIDLVSPEYQRSAKVAKDAAAGAVLLLAMLSVVIGILILGPPLYEHWLL